MFVCFVLLIYLSFCLCLIQICEHYIARGLCDDYPDWSIAAPGFDTSVKIGYEYGRCMTGEEQQVELDLDEDSGALRTGTTRAKRNRDYYAQRAMPA